MKIRENIPRKGCDIELYATASSAFSCRVDAA